MFFIFVVAMSLIGFGIWTIIRIKLNIKVKEAILFNQFNKIHIWSEIFVISVLLALYALIIGSETVPPGVKFHYLGLLFCLFWGFRAFMEHKFYKHTKQCLFSIVTSVFFLIVFLGAELVFYNPVPIRLNAEQIRDITVEFKESGHQVPVILTDIESFKPIVMAVSNGTFMIGKWPVEPSLEMTITLKNGREVVIGEYNFGYPETTAFVVYIDRPFFPREMIMDSQELELIIDQMVGKN